MNIEDGKRWFRDGYNMYYTKEVRQHPVPDSTLKENIDTAQKGAVFGDAPWISEMHGYAFAAAEVDLEHKFTRGGVGVLYGDLMMFSLSTALDRSHLTTRTLYLARYRR